MTSESRVALITGASSGIGAATATAFVRAGFVTYATARRPETLTALGDAGCHVLPLDVTDEASMAAAVQAVEAAHGAVDVLVNNAGYGLYGPLEELPMDDVRRQFETNVFGLLRLSQLVLPGMRRRGGGRIVNIGSIGGVITTPGGGAYHASKYAVEAISDALRMEVYPFGVQVALIQPTGVHTAFSGKVAETLPQTGSDSPYAAFKANYVRTVDRIFTLPGIMQPEDVARAVLHAAQSHRPRTRYKVGATAHVFAAVRRVLPDRAYDAVMSRQFGVT